MQYRSHTTANEYESPLRDQVCQLAGSGPYKPYNDQAVAQYAQHSKPRLDDSETFITEHSARLCHVRLGTPRNRKLPVCSPPNPDVERTDGSRPNAAVHIAIGAARKLQFVALMATSVQSEKQAPQPGGGAIPRRPPKARVP
jgi:hypothetical protein